MPVFHLKIPIRSALRGAYVLCALLFALSGTARPGPVDSLRFVRDMPYICENLVLAPEGWERNKGPGCGDPIFWRAVQGKLEVVPALIRAIRDTTPTTVPVPNTGGNYAVGDVAWAALTEIIHGLPTWELLGVPFDRHNCGDCAYWSYLREDPRHRIAFSGRVKKWYRRHRKDLAWVKSERFETCDGCRNHPNGGHFVLRSGE